jgi:hypothetical protein
LPARDATGRKEPTVSAPPPEQFRVEQVLPSYWRVTFANGPVNLLDPDTVAQLGALIARIERDPTLTVVVFRSETPGYFMAHWDLLADSGRVARMPPGPTGLNSYADNLVRLARLPVARLATTWGLSRFCGEASADVADSGDNALHPAATPDGGARWTPSASPSRRRSTSRRCSSARRG